MKKDLLIGSRGSKLALTQAEWVKARLVLACPEVSVHIEVIKTSGDVRREPLSAIGGKGVFTKELEDALLDSRIDVAVHSLKDLPTILPEALTLSAICEREDARDALVLRQDCDTDGASIRSLPLRAVLGTSSPRRLAQVKNLRQDLVIKDLRGNVDTRLRRLDEGLFDALILASAGLRRLGLENRITARISPEEMLPAVGQGAIGIETRDDDTTAIEAVKKLDHGPTRFACTAERSLLHALGGGCQLPIAAQAVVYYQQLRLEGLVADPEGKKIIRERISGAVADAEKLGSQLAQRLLERGAAALLS